MKYKITKTKVQTNEAQGAKTGTKRGPENRETNRMRNTGLNTQELIKSLNTCLHRKRAGNVQRQEVGSKTRHTRI